MHPYPRHLDGFDYLGPNRYFLTFCTHDRQPLFTAAEHVDLVATHFLRTAGETGFEDLAHCFMPDHLHAIVQGTGERSNLRDFIGRAKQYSGFHFKRTFGRRLWQRYSFEHVVRDDERTEDGIRYVLENPVRARLVRSVADYPYVGSSRYTIEQLLEFACGRPREGSSA